MTGALLAGKLPQAALGSGYHSTGRTHQNLERKGLTSVQQLARNREISGCRPNQYDQIHPRGSSGSCSGK